MLKKQFILGAVLAVFVLAVCLPGSAHAMKVGKYKHGYLGTWENTHDNYNTPGSTGDIEIILKSINRDTGRISKASVYFNDSRAGKMAAKGRIYKAHHVTYLHLHYKEVGYDTSNYVIDATITRNKIVGTYEHEWDSYVWGGTIDLTTTL